jgi:hypothetical protein
MLLPIIEPGLSPELAGDLNGVDAGRLPANLLVAGAMDGAVMQAAERDGGFVARFAPERPRLQVAKMMRIGLFAPANEARLLGHIAQVPPGYDSAAVSQGRGPLLSMPSGWSGPGVPFGLNERSTADGNHGGGPSQRSGASRSSSPAMPTSVNNAATAAFPRSRT